MMNGNLITWVRLTLVTLVLSFSTLSRGEGPVAIDHLKNELAPYGFTTVESCQSENDNGKCWLLSVLSLLHNQHPHLLEELKRVLGIELSSNNNDLSSLNPATQLLVPEIFPNLGQQSINGLQGHQLNQQLALLLGIDIFSLEYNESENTFHASFIEVSSGEFTLSLFSFAASGGLPESIFHLLNMADMSLLFFHESQQQLGHVQAITQQLPSSTPRQVPVTLEPSGQRMILPSTISPGLTVPAHLLPPMQHSYGTRNTPWQRDRLENEAEKQLSDVNDWRKEQSAANKENASLKRQMKGRVLALTGTALFLDESSGYQMVRKMPAQLKKLYFDYAHDKLSYTAQSTYQGVCHYGPILWQNMKHYGQVGWQKLKKWWHQDLAEAKRMSTSDDWAQDGH